MDQSPSDVTHTVYPGEGISLLQSLTKFLQLLATVSISFRGVTLFISDRVLHFHFWLILYTGFIPQVKHHSGFPKYSQLPSKGLVHPLSGFLRHSHFGAVRFQIVVWLVTHSDCKPAAWPPEAWNVKVKNPTFKFWDPLDTVDDFTFQKLCNCLLVSNKLHLMACHCLFFYSSVLCPKSRMRLLLSML